MTSVSLSSGNAVKAPPSEAFTSLAAHLETVPMTPTGVFEDPTSPQYQVALWLADEDTLLAVERLLVNSKLEQRYAAAVFYFATNGVDCWYLCGRGSVSCGDIGWLTAEDECNWFSLFCGDGGTVSMINFPSTGNELKATLPAKMSLFTNLTRFLAPENELEGDLDIAFASLLTLETIALPDNCLTGKFPTGVLEKKAGLAFVSLGGNMLCGTIPAAFAMSTKLSDLQLKSNNLTGSIPLELGTLYWLNNLDLQDNHLDGPLPEELYSLTQLTTLSLQGNEGLIGLISPVISQLSFLHVLQLGETGMTGTLLEEMFSLTDLSELNLEDAPLSGTIPESIRRFNASLMDLFLNDNSFTGAIPEAFDYLTALETLQIQGNELTGSISHSVCAERGLRFQQLATLIVDCVVSCQCCDNCE